MDITEKMIDDHIDWFIGQYGKMIYRYRKINKFIQMKLIINIFIVLNYVTQMMSLREEVYLII